ncbi:helix-turn-helix transcriptional regulator [Carboxylicivirga mesophila]|uniref:Helix-turn-helix transcriptional regulator n=1 Tax=Carboxylicivirga mesophila TaxID=1166478 RepID=A0ABS5KCX3_9BACT|nr:AraC family transcriptional regulator [Carboxylicivirga mesophila]MBS2212677.1 helix-turn-helix transcriptional regulator [Carboxylicivirga mesophila]
MVTLDIKSTNDRKIINFRELGFKNVLVLGHYNYKSAKENLETHSHPGIIEICFFEKGSQNYMINHQNYLLKGGDLLVTYPDEPHGTSSYPEEKGSLYWMLINKPGKNDRLLNLSPKNSQILINRLLSLKSRHFKAIPGIKNILTNIFQAYNKINDPLRLVEINSYILTFLINVIHSGEDDGIKQMSGEIEFICNHIKSHIEDDFDLETLASMIHLSVSRFKHRFKEETGIPPKEFVLRQKIEKAKQILLADSAPVNETAYSLGFTSSSYFATVFKRFTRLKPSEFIIKNTSHANTF